MPREERARGFAGLGPRGLGRGGVGRCEVGAVHAHLRPAQPDPLQQLPLTLTLKSGAIEVNYPVQTTDASGFFTVPVGSLASGSYNWRVKGPSGGANTGTTPGYLAGSGTVTLTGVASQQAEMGVQKAGDVNGDNVVNISDYTALKATFGYLNTDPGYDGRCDYDGNSTIGLADFTALKTNFGQLGADPIGPAGQ